jgi:hypothetical protein
MLREWKKWIEKRGRKNGTRGRSVSQAVSYGDG